MSVRRKTSAGTAPRDAYLTIDGRRWRRSDPAIPDSLRQQLVNELMAARRAVAAAVRTRDLAKARRRVHHAKLALGERGRAWWLEPTAASRRQQIDAAIFALLHSREDKASICPTEVARIVGGTAWRGLMEDVRARAAALSMTGQVDIMRSGHRVTTHPTIGTLRYRLKER